MHTNAAGVTTVHVPEGQPEPTELHPDVVLVGPGSGEQAADVVEEAKPKRKPKAKAAQDSEDG